MLKFSDNSSLHRKTVYAILHFVVYHSYYIKVEPGSLEAAVDV